MCSFVVYLVTCFLFFSSNTLERVLGFFVAYTDARLQDSFFFFFSGIFFLFQIFQIIVRDASGW